MEAIVST
ncbi:hypothetical protein LINPERHAP2_LOCUS38584 [Linum perenne]